LNENGLLKARYFLVAFLFRAHHEIEFYEVNLRARKADAPLKDIEETFLPDSKKRFEDACVELEYFISRELN